MLCNLCSLRETTKEESASVTFRHTDKKAFQRLEGYLLIL